jgi:hypothetical protein
MIYIDLLLPCSRRYLPSEREPPYFSQEITGCGLPTAEHSRTTFSPSNACNFVDVIITAGSYLGTENI